MRTKTGFSKLKCKMKTCGEVSQSSTWRCRCGLLWTNCPRHVHELKAPVRHVRKDKANKHRREATYGVVRPHPTSKDTRGEHSAGTDLSADEGKTDLREQRLLEVDYSDIDINEKPAGVSSMSDWARRQWVKTRKVAKELRSSSAVLPEATRARFAHLLTQSSDNHAGLSSNTPNLPGSFNEPG